MSMKIARAFFWKIKKETLHVDTVENAPYSMVAIWGQWLLTGVKRKLESECRGTSLG